MNHNLEDDDFEFRPLTEGLGFQNKTASAASSSEPKITGFQASAAATSATKKAAIPTATPSQLNHLDMVENSELTSPLPRKGYSQTPTTTKSQTPTSPLSNTVDEILKTLNEKRRHEFTDKKRARITDAPAAETLFQNSNWEFAASMLDLMLVTAGTLLCLIVLLVLTKIDLYANLMRPDAAGMVYLSLLALVSTVSWIYLTVNRVFMGFTPGEWVFDQRLGRPAEQNSAMYAVKAAARAALVIMTGFVVFPILSMIFRKDVLGQMLGLELVRKV